MTLYCPRGDSTQLCEPRPVCTVSEALRSRFLDKILILKISEIPLRGAIRMRKDGHDGPSEMIIYRSIFEPIRSGNHKILLLKSKSIR